MSDLIRLADGVKFLEPNSDYWFTGWKCACCGLKMHGCVDKTKHSYEDLEDHADSLGAQSMIFSHCDECNACTLFNLVGYSRDF